MKILIAPSAYKGSISPLRLARLIAQGVKQVNPSFEVELSPLSDGGDGTIEVLKASLSGRAISVEVAGPNGVPVASQWLMTGNKAVVELASASGIALLKGKKLCPLTASTLGLGQVISNCLNYPISEIIIALGGSASTDGGTGALTALGAKFLDKAGRLLPPGGGTLTELAHIDLSGVDQRLANLSIELAVDVDSPLLGRAGAATNFGPQKGATNEEIAILELGLTNFADLIEAMLRRSLRDIPGAGAAGGTAFGLMAGLGASIKNGFSSVSEMIGLGEKLRGKDLVITGEGKLDKQSFQGKATGQLARLCEASGVPLWVIPGSVAEDLLWRQSGIERLLACARPGEIATEQDVIEASMKIFALSAPQTPSR
jgi:glycerate kinase